MIVLVLTIYLTLIYPLSPIITIVAATPAADAVSNPAMTSAFSLLPTSANDLFKCPEKFGYFPDSWDCSKYFVSVFGEALHESCTGGLYFSAELQTCDWPRNVPCLQGSSVPAAIHDNLDGEHGDDDDGHDDDNPSPRGGTDHTLSLSVYDEVDDVGIEPYSRPKKAFLFHS